MSILEPRSLSSAAWWMCARSSPIASRFQTFSKPLMWLKPEPDLKSSSSLSPGIIRPPSEGIGKLFMDPIELLIFSNPEQDAQRPLEQLLQNYHGQANVHINDIGWD